MAGFLNYLKAVFQHRPSPAPPVIDEAPVVRNYASPGDIVAADIVPLDPPWTPPVREPPPVVNTFDPNAGSALPRTTLVIPPPPPPSIFPKFDVDVPMPKLHAKKAKAAPRKSKDRPWVKPRTRK